jgi:hypothetical protein
VGVTWERQHRSARPRDRRGDGADPSLARARQRAREAEAGYWLPLAVGGGAVWVANLLDGKVARYDLATGRITMIDVGGHPWDIVFARGSIWAALPGRLPGPPG